MFENTPIGQQCTLRRRLIPARTAGDGGLVMAPKTTNLIGCSVILAVNTLVRLALAWIISIQNEATIWNYMFSLQQVAER